MKLLNLILLLTIFLSYNANCSLLIDPYIGSVSGNWDNENTDPDDDYKLSGTGIGLRVGGLLLNTLMIGAVVDLASVTGKNKGITGLELEYKYTNSGIFLGYKGSLMRFWYTYYLNAKLEMVNFSGTNSTIYNLLLKGAEYEGTGQAIGLAISPFDFISIFAQLHIYKYDKFTLANGLSGTVGDAGSAYWLLGISFPITIF
jgi:hypothetical protein